MDGITAAHVVKILLYMEKQSHYIAALFYFFGEILPTGDKKNPVTSRKELKKRTLKTFTIFHRKKGRIRQI
jgi:hypothetical protein